MLTRGFCSQWAQRQTTVRWTSTCCAEALQVRACPCLVQPLHVAFLHRCKLQGLWEGTNAAKLEPWVAGGGYPCEPCRGLGPPQRSALLSWRCSPLKSSSSACLHRGALQLAGSRLSSWLPAALTVRLQAASALPTGGALHLSRSGQPSWLPAALRLRRQSRLCLCLQSREAWLTGSGQLSLLPAGGPCWRCERHLPSRGGSDVAPVLARSSLQLPQKLGKPRRAGNRLGWRMLLWCAASAGPGQACGHLLPRAALMRVQVRGRAA